METIKKDDFVEISFTGRANGEIFDTNEKAELDKLDSKTEPRKLIIIVGRGMLVPGFDKEIEGKEIGKRYTISMGAKDGFGERRRELVRTIPLRSFTEQKVYPQAGMTLALDGNLVRISAISGSRVIADFNNPLAGKDLTYDFTIVRKVSDIKERTETFFSFFLRFVPEFEVKDKVIVKAQKALEPLFVSFNDRFKELVGMELAFEVVEKPVETQQSL